MAIDVSELIPQQTTPVNSRWRRIVTPIPVPESVPVIERLRAVEPRSMGGMPPILWHEAEGFLVRDPFGNQWIDLTSGIVVANAGHSHPRILDAIRQATGGCWPRMPFHRRLDCSFWRNWWPSRRSRTRKRFYSAPAQKRPNVR